MQAQGVILFGLVVGITFGVRRHGHGRQQGKGKGQAYHDALSVKGCPILRIKVGLYNIQRVPAPCYRLAGRKNAR